MNPYRLRRAMGSQATAPAPRTRLLTGEKTPSIDHDDTRDAAKMKTLVFGRLD